MASSEIGAALSLHASPAAGEHKCRPSTVTRSAGQVTHKISTSSNDGAVAGAVPRVIPITSGDDGTSARIRVPKPCQADRYHGFGTASFSSSRSSSESPLASAAGSSFESVTTGSAGRSRPSCSRSASDSMSDSLFSSLCLSMRLPFLLKHDGLGSSYQSERAFGSTLVARHGATRPRASMHGGGHGGRLRPADTPGLGSETT
jgi:hypothetical protein